MPGYQFPYSSSPPSTPDRRTNGSGALEPSTTPAGPPPSSAGSFTPAGPPPSSILGNVSYDLRLGNQPFQSLRFSKETVLKPPKPQFHGPMSSPSVAPYIRSSKAPLLSGLGNEYKALPLTSKQTGFSADFDEEGEDEEIKIDNNRSGFENEGYMNEAESQRADFNYFDDDMEDLRFNSSGPVARPNANNFNMSQQSNSFRLSQNGYRNSFGSSITNSRQEPPREVQFAKIAKDFHNQIGTPRVTDSEDGVILGTEELIMQLYEDGIRASEDEDALSQALAIIPRELLRLWADYESKISAHISEEYAATIGPGPRAPAFAKANFLTSLLLRLYQPHSNHSANDNSPFLRSSLLRGSIPPAIEGKAKKIPLLLLEWIDDFHNPYPSQLDELQRHRPSPAHHPLFWNTILNSLLRGRVVAVVNALKTAGWRYARNSSDDRDGSEEGYTGPALKNIEKVINDAIQILQQCPAIKGDWDIKDSDWTLFRLGIHKAKEALRTFAEGQARARHDSPEADSFSKPFMPGQESYSGIAKKAESRVPWDIYQNLLTIYNLILGDFDPIVESSQDWCEATIGLVVWWNPNRDDRRLALRRSRLSTETDSESYLWKIADSFYRATEETTGLQVNANNPVEVGLASLFEGDIESVIGLLSSWSGPVSAAVVEIASLGGWIPHTESQSATPMDDLDQDDMDLLGINPQSGNRDSLKDHTLIAYAAALTERVQLESKPKFGRPQLTRNGWELAIEVLGRLDSAKRSEEEVGSMIHDLSFNSEATVDKLWRLLNQLGMAVHAENIAEEYADSVAESTYKYGEALWYYALAHKQSKVKDVLDLLISFSLIHSVAYPPEAELDDHLRRLISSPKSTLKEMSRLDYEGAKLLHKMLSGYATLRRFYDLRDEEVGLSTAQKPNARALARKSDAASALIAVIASSDDNIRGGLYDETRGAVVNVDFLLALLGEVMVFIDQLNPTITPSQIDILLKAIEDLQTVPQRVYSACNEFFQTVMASAQGLKGSSPMDLLKKSTSSLSGTSNFSLVGSSIFASQLQRSMNSSGVLVKASAKRGWDWRRGLVANIKGEEILRILRLGLAKEIARAWVLEADGQF